MDNEIIIDNIADNEPLFTYGDNITITTRDIYNTLNNVAIDYGLNGLTDLKDREKVSSAMFNNIILKSVGKRLFKQTKALKCSDNLNKYDRDKLIILSYIYINICNIFDIMCTYDGFESLIGCGDNFLQQFENNDTLNAIKPLLTKTFTKVDNDIQKSKARDSKQAILNLAYNNYNHGWNGEIKQNEIKATAKTLEDIRQERMKISVVDGQNNQ